MRKYEREEEGGEVGGMQEKISEGGGMKGER